MTEETISLLKKAFYAGAMYEATLSESLNFTNFIKDIKKEQLSISGVMQAKPEKVCFRCGKPVKKKGNACYDCSLIDK